MYSSLLLPTGRGRSSSVVTRTARPETASALWGERGARVPGRRPAGGAVFHVAAGGHVLSSSVRALPICYLTLSDSLIFASVVGVK